MRILLIGNYLLDGQESMLRFAELLKSELTAQGVTVTLLQPKPYLTQLIGRRGNPHRGFVKLLAYLDKFVLFPMDLLRAVKNHDVMHICDHSNAMYGQWNGGKPWIVTCNDLLAVRSALGEFPQNPTRWSGKVLQKWILSWLSRAPKVACISDATLKDVLRLTDQIPSRLSVIHMGLNHSYTSLPEGEWKRVLSQFFVERSVKSPAQYIFHVGGNQWYKNRSGVIRLFAGLAAHDSKLELLIAGKPATGEQLQLVCDLNLEGRVHFLGSVTDRELSALYHGAEFMLFPSLAEGFGWPVIEAQACGCRVATSELAPLPEVGGTRVAYLDLDNPSDCIARLLELLYEPDEKRRLRIETGYENVKRFEPARMIERYLELYQKC